MRDLTQLLSAGGARLLFALAVWLYGGEGANLLLRFLPMRTIDPLLRRYGARIGKNVRFHAPVVVHNAAAPGPLYRRLTVGPGCYLGRDLLLDLQDRIVLEERVTLSLRVSIFTHTDVGNSPLRDHLVPVTQAPVTIRRGAYVGAGVTILQGVEVGECAVLAAGAVVIRDVPPYTVVAGVPARAVRSLRVADPESTLAEGTHEAS